MTLFTLPSAWDGGSYQLAIELGDRPPGDARDRIVRAAHLALWKQRPLEGCYLDPGREPGDQDRREPEAAIPWTGSCCGILTLPSGVRAPCASWFVREGLSSGSEPGAVDEDLGGLDWMVLGIPMGALASLDPRVGGYPFGEEDPSCWRDPLDGLLVGIGRAIFEAIPYALAIIGHQVSGLTDSSTLRRRGGPPLESRYESYLWPRDGRLHLFPAQRPAAPFA